MSKNDLQEEKSVRRRGTFKQRKLAKRLVENAIVDKPLNAGQLLENIGYAKNTAEAIPNKIIEAEGVKIELALLGFDEESAKKVVGEILHKQTAQDKDRLKAADMVFDVFGTKAPIKSITAQVNLENREYIEAITKKVMEQMKYDELSDA